jgi:hypothetical protein
MLHQRFLLVLDHFGDCTLGARLTRRRGTHRCRWVNPRHSSWFLIVAGFEEVRSTHAISPARPTLFHYFHSFTFQRFRKLLTSWGQLTFLPQAHAIHDRVLQFQFFHRGLHSLAAGNPERFMRFKRFVKVSQWPRKGSSSMQWSTESTGTIHVEWFVMPFSFRKGFPKDRFL